MFDKHTIYPRGGFNANRVHRQGYNKDDYQYNIKDTTNIALAKAGERRMFNEWEIETRAERRHPNADGSVNVGTDIKINKRRPYGDYYKYGLIK